MGDVVGGVLILLGALFGAVAGLGQLRFSDLFVRMHLATKPATLGLALVAGGAMFWIDDQGARTLLGLIVVLQFVTAPTAAHLVSRAAHRRGTWDRADAVLDELAEVDEL